MDEDVYAGKINKVIALAPCMYLEMDNLRDGGVLDYQGVVDYYEIQEANSKWYYEIFPGHPVNSMQGLLFWDQIYTENRPQRFISLEDYSDGQRQSEAIELSNISRVQIVMFSGSNDNTCTNQNAHRILTEVGNP